MLVKSYNFNSHPTVTVIHLTKFISNQTLKVYDSIGKLIKTINTKNSIYSNEYINRLATGMYDIVLTQFSMKPLKFVIGH